MTCFREQRSLADRAGPVQPECVFHFRRAITSVAHSRPEWASKRRAPAFYSAAAIPREQSIRGGCWRRWTGQVHLLDGVTDQVVEKLNWGSDIASMRSGCGSGWQVLATGGGAGRNDAVQAFEATGREPVAASAPLEVGGAVTALWTESGGTQRAWRWYTIRKRGDMRPSGLLLLVAVSLSLAIAAPARTRPHYGGTLRLAMRRSARLA